MSNARRAIGSLLERKKLAYGINVLRSCFSDFNVKCTFVIICSIRRNLRGFSSISVTRTVVNICATPVSNASEWNEHARIDLLFYWSWHMDFVWYFCMPRSELRWLSPVIAALFAVLFSWACCIDSCDPFIRNRTSWDSDYFLRRTAHLLQPSVQWRQTSGRGVHLSQRRLECFLF